MKRALLTTLRLVDCAVIAGWGLAAMAWIALTPDAELQAELPAEPKPEPTDSPWCWQELRQQPVRTAARDVNDVIALRQAADAEGVLALLSRPL